jgi:hypothetical protein
MNENVIKNTLKRYDSYVFDEIQDSSLTTNQPIGGPEKVKLLKKKILKSYKISSFYDVFKVQYDLIKNKEFKDLMTLKGGTAFESPPKKKSRGRSVKSSPDMMLSINTEEKNGPMFRI